LSNKVLFEITGTKPLIVAFPNGNFNNKILDIAADLGFQIAFTTINKLNCLPITVNNNKLISLNRFMAKPISIKKYGGLNRLGYTSKSLYADIKKALYLQKNKTQLLISND
jgi:hypothetical protein